MASGSAGDQGHFHPLRALVERAIVDGAFPGASWGIWQRGQLRCLASAGHFTYDPASPTVSTGTVYDLASVSKVVATTAMTMLLYQRGKVTLDTPLGDLLPGFVIAAERGSAKRLVTLRLLLAHASGLPGYAPLFLKYADANSLLRACLHMRLEAPPGTRAEYSDIGFILLGKALELVARESLDSFCSREVFAALGMHATRYRPALVERTAIPPTEMDELFRQRVVQGEVHDENCFVLGGCAGHAGLFAPAADLLSFAESILAPLRAEHTQPTLFQPEIVKLFIAPAKLHSGSSRALGWDTPSPPSSSGIHFHAGSVGHLGYTGTSLWIDPLRDLAIAFLTNRTWPSRENKKIHQVRPAFHNLAVELL